MTRQIIALGGSMASFAVANDGTGWFWDGEKWTPWGRTDLPQPFQTEVKTRLSGTTDRTQDAPAGPFGEMVPPEGKPFPPLAEEFQEHYKPGPGGLPVTVTPIAPAKRGRPRKEKP